MGTGCRMHLSGVCRHPPFWSPSQSAIFLQPLGSNPARWVVVRDCGLLTNIKPSLSFGNLLPLDVILQVAAFTLTWFYIPLDCYIQHAMSRQHLVCWYHAKSQHPTCRRSWRFSPAQPVGHRRWAVCPRDEEKPFVYVDGKNVGLSCTSRVVDL